MQIKRKKKQIIENEDKKIYLHKLSCTQIVKPWSTVHIRLASGVLYLAGCGQCGGYGSVWVRAGVSLIGFPSESLVFCEKMSA